MAAARVSELPGGTVAEEGMAAEADRVAGTGASTHVAHLPDRERHAQVSSIWEGQRKGLPSVSVQHAHRHAVFEMREVAHSRGSRDRTSNR